jgi:hypothetical protein
MSAPELIILVTALVVMWLGYFAYCLLQRLLSRR